MVQKRFKKDETVFFIINGTVHEGIIASEEDQYGFFEIEDLTVVQSVKIHKSEMDVIEENVIIKLHKRNEKKLQEYENEISDLTSLVEFMFNHNIYKNYDTDWEARIITIKKAKEFGINLNHKS